MDEIYPPPADEHRNRRDGLRHRNRLSLDVGRSNSFENLVIWICFEFRYLSRQGGVRISDFSLWLRG